MQNKILITHLKSPHDFFNLPIGIMLTKDEVTNISKSYKEKRITHKQNILLVIADHKLSIPSQMMHVSSVENEIQ